jgi:hypothetical protein
VVRQHDPPEPTRMRSVTAAICPIRMSGAALATEGGCGARRASSGCSRAGRPRARDRSSCAAPARAASGGDEGEVEHGEGGMGRVSPVTRPAGRPCKIGVLARGASSRDAAPSAPRAPGCRR